MPFNDIRDITYAPAARAGVSMAVGYATGALVLTALVQADGVIWYESKTYMGYNKRESLANFLSWLTWKNWRITEHED
jgi:hypothetical protein